MTKSSTDKIPPNPFRMAKEEMQGHLEELGDTELLDLLDTVSDDLKRRNNLLPRPGSPGNGVDAVRTVVDTLFKDK